jgi:hypothetical protein
MMIGAAADLTAKALAAAAVGAMLPLSAMADAVRVYDVDDYVQDGLVLHFDGIRNAGATAAHDPNATTWKNLVDDSHDATKTTFASPANASTAGSWAGNGYVFGGRDYFAIDSLSLGDEVTVQSMVDYDNSNQVGTYPVLFGATSANSDSFVVFVYKQAGYQINFKLFGKPSHSMKPTWSPPYVTAIYDNANGRISIDNAVTSVWQTANSGVSGNLGDWTYAIGTGQNSDTEKKKRIFMGTYHSLRVYTNVLSNSELAWNRQVDDARYRTAQSMGKGNDDVNVIVASNVEGVEGADECGKWHIAEGTHTFTAPATRIVGKIGYTLNGYTIQTWNGTEWGAAVTNSGASYTASASDAKVRLTWLWTPTIHRYDVDDYVQDDLILHFDGIRNAGATVAHDSTQRTWKNIVAGQTDATFSNDDYGYWTEDGKGFYFEGYGRSCYAQLDTAVTFGDKLTIQLVTAINTSDMKGGSSKDNDRWPSYFHTGDSSKDFGLYGDAVNANVTPTWVKFKSSKGSNRPQVSSWGGEYLTAMLDGSVGYLTQTTNRDDSKITNAGNGLNGIAERYCWGGSAVHASRAIKGTYYSVRIYTNVLDNAQLAKNKLIDDIRFRNGGVVEVVNGAVGETGESGASSLPDGIYNIDTGAWTITAPEIKSGGHTYKAKLFVERYNATSGKWEATMAKPQWTESYVVDKSALGNSRIRLTWTWEMRKGLNIIIR